MTRKPRNIRPADTAIFFAWVAVDWGIIVATIIAAVRLDNLFACWLATLIVGNRQHALAILGHEVGHWLAAENEFINNRLGCLFTFWPLGISLTAYRRFHFRHHRLVGSEGDPERVYKRATHGDWDVPVPASGLVLLTMMDLFAGYGVYHVYKVFRLAKPATVAESLSCLLPIVATLALLLTGNWAAAAIWYASLVTSFWAAFRWRVWFEHQEPAAVTSRVNMPRLLRILIAPHNTWLHWEHHECPNIPQHRLGEVREAFQWPEPVPAGILLSTLTTHRTTT